MKSLVIVATIVGSGTLASAHPMHRHGQYSQPRPQDFLGLYEGQRPVVPFHENRGTCNGGPCSLTGGPSGGPNQS